MRARPNLGQEPTAEQVTAVQALIDELERGFNTHDADVFNRRFAGDILWGNPNGGVLQGFDELHGVHRAFFSGPLADAHSRYTLQRVIFPTADVAAAFVRREAIGPHGELLEPTTADDRLLQELALYVLVQRDGEWWLAAGANTPAS